MIRIIVDSGADYRQSELAEKQIELVPLQVTFGEQTYADGVDLTRKEFFQMLCSRKDFPHTSQPSPEAFANIFADAKEEGDTLICLTVSSLLSGTFQSAAIAKQMVRYDGIYLVDSRSASVGIQFLADRACKLRDAGADISEIVQELEDMRSRICIYFVVDTLEYLYRGGRLSRTGSLAGRLVHMKPVLTLDRKGEVLAADLCLGSARAIRTAAGYLKKSLPDPAFPVYSLYSTGFENCGKLEERLEEMGIRFDRRQIGCAIGAHVGPGVAGAAYVGKG